QGALVGDREEEGRGMRSEDGWGSGSLGHRGRWGCRCLRPVCCRILMCSVMVADAPAARHDGGGGISRRHGNRLFPVVTQVDPSSHGFLSSLFRLQWWPSPVCSSADRLDAAGESHLNYE